MSEWLLGVDPGKNGALAIIETGTMALVAVEDMPPATGAALGASIAALLEDWKPFTICEAWVEKVGYMPGQRGGWTFAENYGAILGALGALGVPVHHISAAGWKRAQRVTADKNTSRQRAVELWPAQASWFARVKDDGRAEAALIARYGAMADG